MKITQVDVMMVEVNASQEPMNRCRPVVCRIHTDDGLYGDGEAAMLLMTGAAAAYGMLQDLAEFIIGMDPLAHEVVWNKLYRRTYFAQNGGPVMYAAISATDMALWDIKGKAFGVPVYQLLGGKHRDSLPCYASQFHSGWGPHRVMAHTPEQFAANAKIAVAEGYTVLKADFLITDGDGKSLTEEQRTGRLSPPLLALAEDRIAAVRQAVGPDIGLIVEGHGYLDAQTALQLAERIKQYDIAYFEEPCTPFLPTARFLAREMGIPVSGGERLFSRWQYAPYIQERLYQLLQPDIGNCGGITEVKKIIDMAAVYELGVQIHCCASPLCVAAALQVEAAMPSFLFHEHTGFQTNAFIRELCTEDYQPVNGVFSVPDRPGLGNELSPFALTHCIKAVIK